MVAIIKIGVTCELTIVRDNSIVVSVSLDNTTAISQSYAYLKDFDIKEVNVIFTSKLCKTVDKDDVVIGEYLLDGITRYAIITQTDLDTVEMMVTKLRIYNYKVYDEFSMYGLYDEHCLFVGDYVLDQIIYIHVQNNEMTSIKTIRKMSKKYLENLINSYSVSNVCPINNDLLNEKLSERFVNFHLLSEDEKSIIAHSLFIMLDDIGHLNISINTPNEELEEPNEQPVEETDDFLAFLDGIEEETKESIVYNLKIPKEDEREQESLAKFMDEPKKVKKKHKPKPSKAVKTKQESPQSKPHKASKRTKVTVSISLVIGIVSAGLLGVSLFGNKVVPNDNQYLASQLTTIKTSANPNIQNDKYYTDFVQSVNEGKNINQETITAINNLKVDGTLTQVVASGETVTVQVELNSSSNINQYKQELSSVVSNVQVTNLGTTQTNGKTTYRFQLTGTR